MNKLLHSAVNKFNNINLMCGTFALKIEEGVLTESGITLLKKKLKKLMDNIGQNIEEGKILMAEITVMLKDTLNCYYENESLLETIDFHAGLLESKFNKLKDDLTGGNYDIAANYLTASLRIIGEKALACGIVLNELKCALEKSGKYRQR